MNKKIKVAIVGFGWFGKQHFKVYRDMREVEIVSICDLAIDQLSGGSGKKSLQDEFHKDVNKKDEIQLTGISLYDNIDDMLDKEEIDVVDITAIESEHYILAKKALLKGKNIIIEKPMTIKYADAKELYDIARNNNRFIYVGNVLRFDRRYNALSDIIEKHGQNDIRHLSLERNFQSKSHYVYGRVNPVYSSCVHDIDLTLWLSKNKVVSVQAFGNHFLDRENPDVVICVLKLESGAYAVIQNIWHINENCPYGFEFSTKLIFNEGTYSIKNEPDINCWTGNGVENPELFFWPSVGGKIEGALQTELQHYIDCAGKDIESDVLSMENAIESIKIANALEIALAEKREVLIKEFE